MIKFFRRIRQNLLSEGKTGTYLKYAIGEIILVVIGILIALQINNWNEQRKEQNLVENFIDRVRLDINKDKIELARIIEIQKNNKQHIEYLLISLESETLDNQTKVDSIFNVVFSASSTFYPIVGSYRSALSTGILGLMGETDLLNLIVGLYDSYDRLDYNGKTLDNKFYKMNEKYKYERRIGRLKSMSSEETVALMNDLKWYEITIEYYINRCSETIDLIDKVLEKQEQTANI